MKNLKIIGPIVTFLICLVIVFIVTSSKDTKISKGLTVGASIFPLVDITRNIAGDKVDVIQVLPAGASPHTYSPNPKQVAELEDTQIIFAIGHGLDDWINDFGEVKVVDDGIKLRQELDNEEEGSDPHYWLSVENAKLIAQNILQELTTIDPANSDYYQQNYLLYIQELDSLQIELNQILGDKQYDIVTFHDAFGYLAEETGINILTSIEPFAGKEPSAKYLEEVGRIIEEYNLKVIYNEPQLANKSLEIFVDQFQVQIATLDPIGGVEGRNSYQDLLRYNIRQIAQYN